MSEQSDPVAAEDFPILQKHSTTPGWLIDVYASSTTAGVVITRLDIRTDPKVNPPNGVTATVLDSIKLPAFRAEISEMLHNAADALEAAANDPGISPALGELLSEKADRVSEEAKKGKTPSGRRTSLKKQRVWAQQAEEALTAANEAREQRIGLSSILEEEWEMERESVRSRLRRLRERRYIEGQGRSIQPGPALDLWRERHTDKQQEE